MRDFPQAFKNMFREYDIRGMVNEQELNEQNVYEIILAYGVFLQRRGISKAVVGYDNRTCSEPFAESAIRALRECGIDVVYVGLSLSPVVYYAQYHYECEGAVMITASHNPNGWSGFKLASGYSKTLDSVEIKELYAILASGEKPSSDREGALEVSDVRDAYLEQIVSRIKMGKKPLKVVIDAGNGGAGVFAYELFQKLGCMTFQLNCDPDTSYPHYFPNPSDMTERARLREMVLHPYIQADVGIGFDGDGDRIGVMDEKGQDIWSDLFLAVLTQQVLAKYPGATIVFDVKCSQALEDVINACGGEPFMWRTGHSYIKSKMQELGAELAGERSGHIFFGKNEYLGFDDGLFVGAKLVEFLSNREEPLSEIVRAMPQYVNSPEIKAHCADEKKYQVMEAVVDEMKRLFPGRVNDINGARVSFEHGWGLVRPSSNMPEVVLIFEADTREHMNEIKEQFRAILKNYPDISAEWENEG